MQSTEDFTANQYKTVGNKMIVKSQTNPYQKLQSICNWNMSCGSVDILCTLCVFLKVFLYLYLVPANSRRCKHQMSKDVEGVAADGHITLGGLFPIHFGIADQKDELRKNPIFPGCTK